MDFQAIAYALSVWTIPVLIAVTLHEAAHGWAAWKLGDDTAKQLGRVTFNPIKHIHPMGTVILPAGLLLLSGGKMMFGFAKPVPVNFQRLNHPRRDMVLVAAAGPGMNVLIALAGALSIHLIGNLPDDIRDWVGANLGALIWLNCLLAVFNMLPIPPLDGGRVAVGLLPLKPAMALARLERVGIFIVLGGLLVLPMLGQQVGVDLNVFQWLVLAPADGLREVIGHLAGIY
ncbi:MAG: site-2 protease family protein [Magnetovibrionaceae bacterium]